MEFETTTPSVSDIALQLMVAALQGGNTMLPVEAAFAYAEQFAYERDILERATGWLEFPANVPSAEGWYLVEYKDGSMGVECARETYAHGLTFTRAMIIVAFHPIPKRATVEGS